MADKSPLDEPIYRDSRGEIRRHNINDTKFNILTSKAGSIRSGDYHPSIQFDIILKGEVKITLRKEDKDIEIVKKDNEFISIPENTPHLFEFTKDTVMIEWWDKPFEAKFYEPYREKVLNNIKRKILVTGAAGLLGSNVVFEGLNQNYEMYGCYLNNKVKIPNANLIKLDLSKETAIKEIEKINPDCIIHCAGLVNLDSLEQNPLEAESHIVKATKNVAIASKKTNSQLIYISTDALFDGKKGNYTEEDTPNPINVYGKAKLKAEEEIKKEYERHTIIRTNIYGWNLQENKFSLAEWMLNKLRSKEEFTGFEDVVYSPISTNNLSKILFEIFKKNYYGTLNIGPKNPCTKLEFAQKLAKIFDLDQSLIKSGNSNSMKFKAKRPKNVSLNTEKAQKMFNIKTINEDLLDFKGLENENNQDRK
jgi:dTDP-4-dehydrorhamnose reductase